MSMYKTYAKIFASLAMLAILVTPRTTNAQLNASDTFLQSPSTIAQTIAEDTAMTSAESLMARVQAGYANRSSLHLETSDQWQPGENLSAGVPVDWLVGYQSLQGNLQTIEFVPTGQTIDNWQSLLTVQILNGHSSQNPQQIFEETVALFRSVCTNFDVSPVITGEENGYPFALWIQNCPNNPQINQAEIALFKVIQGNDSLYFVHRAWHTPSLSPHQAIPIDPAELQTWGEYMRLVGVCDTRIAERHCS